MINTVHRVYHEHYPGQRGLLLVPYVGAWAGQWTDVENRRFITRQVERDCEEVFPHPR